MTTAARPRTLLDRIGGPAATSWPVIAVAAGFTWMAFILLLPAPAAPQQAVRVVFTSVAQALMVAILRVAHATILRDTARRPRPWVTLGVYGVASVGFTAALGVMIAQQDVSAPAENTFGYTDTIVAIVVVLLISAVAVDAIGQYRRQQAELTASAARLEHVRRVVGGLIAERRQAVVDSVSLQVIDVVGRLAVDSPRETVETLRWAAQDLVRPLSHDLATRTVTFTPTFPTEAPTGFNWRRMLADATSGAPIRPIALPVVSTMLTITYRVSAHGWHEGLLDTVTNALAIGVGALMANRALAVLERRLPVPLRVVAVTVLLGVLGFVGVVVQRMFGQQQGTPATLAANVVITVFIGWAIALLRAVQLQLDRTDVAIEALQRDLDWEIARANQVQWQQQQALARVMHGPVQSAVNAAALRIDAASRDGSVTGELIEQERASILRALDDLPSAAQDRVPDLELDFRRITGTWAGLCDIDIAVPGDLLAGMAQDPACSSAVTDIVTECCANAIRHGHARRVHVVIERSDDRRMITLTIDNDGDPLQESAGSGLGTSLIDDVALDWHREATPTGTHMVVSLPIEAFG